MYCTYRLTSYQCILMVQRKEVVTCNMIHCIAQTVLKNFMPRLPLLGTHESV